jgi:hypothetical protein
MGGARIAPGRFRHGRSVQQIGDTTAVSARRRATRIIYRDGFEAGYNALVENGIFEDAAGRAPEWDGLPDESGESPPGPVRSSRAGG